MILKIQRKGKKLLLIEAELKEYMDAKLQEITGLASSVLIAFFMVTMVAVLTVFRADDIFLYLLILAPLIVRRYVHDMVASWLRKKFTELIGWTERANSGAF
jgi:hypothetical protein